MLLRFNVMTRVKEIRKGDYRPCYNLLVFGAENQLRFLDEIGVHGERAVMARRSQEMLRLVKGNTNLDTIPRDVWDKVKAVLAEQHMTHREF